jgi:transposase
MDYQLHRLLYEDWGTRSFAKLPVAVPTGQCGPRLAAFTGLTVGHFSSEHNATRRDW